MLKNNIDAKSSVKYLDFVFGLLFLGFIAWFKFQYHELWKDEWQAWFVAKDKGVGELLSFLYYEGHPVLWYLYLKIFSIFSNNHNDLTLLNVAHLVTVAVGLYFLFVRFRFPLLLKILFAASYFLLFEYGIVNRGYFLVIVFAFWAAWLLSQKDYNAKTLTIVLFLLCQTEVYGVFIAISLGLYMWYDKYISGQRTDTNILGGIGLGFLVFVLSVFPRDFGHIAKTSGQTWQGMEKLLAAFQGNLANVYMPGLTNDTFAHGSTAAGMVFSLLILIGLYFIFKSDKAALFSMALFLAAVISFSFLFFLGGIRQWGMGFVFFIALLQLRGLNWQKEKIITAITAIFCVFNVIYAVRAVKIDFEIPFTNAKEAGIFIKNKVPEKVPIVALNKFDATPVVGYSERKFYELPSGTPFSYFKWVDKIYVPTESELKLFGQYKGVGGIILLSPKPIDTDRYPSAQLWQKFDKINYKNESYYIYTLSVK